MSKVAKWIFPAAGGKDGIIGTAKAVVGFMTGNWGMIASGAAQVAGLGKKKQAAQERQANVTTLSVGEVPREAVLGQTCTAGSLIDVFSFGGKHGTDTVTYCVGLADHALDGIVGYYVDDQYYPWTGEGFQPGFSNKLSLHFRQATADGWVPPAHVLAAGAGWKTTDRLAGIAHIWIDTHLDDKVWSRGWPKFKFVLRGLRAFDPRFDPALGYAGPNPQTWEDRASHRFTTNAALLRYAVARGIYAEGHHGEEEHLLIGRGLSAEEAPPARIIAAANLCDELVNGKPRYAASGVINTSDDFATVEEMFATAMAGMIVQREGGVEVEPGQAKAAVVTITDADLVTGAAASFSRFRPDGSDGRINTVVSRYIEPAQGYKDHAGPVRRSIPDIQKDHGPREMTLVQMLVTDVDQADRNAEIARRRSRCERRSQIVLPPAFAALEEGDWIAWQSDRYHDGATVRYLVETFDLNKEWRNSLSLTEIASSVFGGVDPVEDRPNPPPPPPVIDALSLTGVAVEAVTLAADPVEPSEGESAAGGSTVPAIRFKWDVLTPPPEGEEGEPTEAVDAAIRAIRAEVRVVGGDEVAPTRTEEVRKGVLVTTNGVGANQTLEARLVPIGEPWRPVLPSAWFTVTTGTLIAGGLSPDSPDWDAIRQIAEESGGSEAIAEAEARMEAALATAKSQLEAADAMTASALLAADTRLTNAVNGKASNATVTALKSQADGLSAWRVTAEQVLTDLPNNYASASSVTGLQSEVTAARSGSPTLLARMTADRQVVTDGLAGKASASDLTALTSRMTSAEGVNTAQNTRLNTVETDLAGKASSTALATLSSEVTGARNGSATLGAQLTSMRQTVVDGLAGKAASSDLTNLAATVTTQGTTISGHSTRLTTVESDLVGKASASSVSDLTTEARAKNKVFVQSSPPTATQVNDIWINTADGQRTYIWRNADGWQEFRDARVAPLQTVTTTLSSNVSSLQTSVSDLQTGKANAADLTTLTTRVSSVEGVNTAQNTRLNTAESDILGKASSTSVATLSSEVTAARNGSATLSAQLTSMRQTVSDGLAGKASSTDVTTLTSRVGTAEASATTALTTAADALGKANSTYGVVLDANNKATGFQLANNGVSTTFDIVADKFRVSNGVSTVAPFSYVGGVLSAGSLRLTGSIDINGLFVVTSAGEVTMRSSTGASRMETTSRALKAFNNGVLRAQFGDLTA